MRADALLSPLIVAFFRDIVAEGDTAMAPMLELVQLISSKPHAQSMWAGTSLHSLVIGTSSPDTLSITFLPQVDLFQIQYFDATTRKHETHRCPTENAESLVDSLLLRLSLSDAQRVAN